MELILKIIEVKTRLFNLNQLLIIVVITGAIAVLTGKEDYERTKSSLRSDFLDRHSRGMED
ncbi:MAG: hypothetical protein K8R25_08635 [Methanosarcinales archaeon]|nr:hypothetical protein [Methanosarcinales archaeon]